MKLPTTTRSVVVSYHPAHAMHGFPMAMPGIESAIRRARVIADDDGRPPRHDIDLILDPTPDKLRAYLASAPLSHHVALDVETPMDNPTKIDLIGISNRPWSAIVFPNLPAFMDIVNGVLTDKSRVKTGHNFIGYDIRAFRHNGCDVVWPVSDTMHREALLYPSYKEAKKRRWLSLSTCVQRRLQVPYWKDDGSVNTQALYRVWFPKVPEWMHPRLYCGLDVAFTWMIHPMQKVELEQAGMGRLYGGVVAPAALEMSIVEDDGMMTDPKAIESWESRTEGEIKECMVSVSEFAVGAHNARVVRLKAAIEELDKVIGENEAAHPWRADNPELDPVRCATHPKYKGMTKRQKCDGCVTVYEAAASTRSNLKIFKTRRTKARDRLKRVGEKFQPSNDNHWRALLFTETKHGGLGLTPTRLTGKMGLAGVDEGDITELQQIYPDCELLGWRVKLQHLHHRLAWVRGLEPDENNRVHFTYSFHRAVNGQVSSGLDDDEPDKVRESGGGNALNVREEDRHVFIAEPGTSWVEQDYSQIELRIMAWLAEDRELLATLRDGADVHSLNAAAIFGCRKDETRTFRVAIQGTETSARQVGKKCTHRWNYGGMDKKLGKSIRPCEKWELSAVKQYLHDWDTRTGGNDGVGAASWHRRQRAASKAPNPDVEHRKFIRRMYDVANTLMAREWRLAYFARWPKLAEFQNRIIEQVERTRELTNPLGRSLRFYGFRWDFNEHRFVFEEREDALAFLPASTARDINKALIPTIAQIAREHGGRLLTTTYDSYSVQVPNERVPDYVKAGQAAMECTWPELGQLKDFGYFWCPVDTKVGKNWGPHHCHECYKDGCVGCENAAQDKSCDWINPAGLQDFK